MRPRFIVAAVGVLLTLTACQTSSDSQALSTASQQSPGARSGDQPVAAARAEQLFVDLCVNQGPTYRDTDAAAIGYGFVPGRSSDSYVHPTENLYVKAIDGTCIFVFASTASEQVLEQAFMAYESQQYIVIFDLFVYDDGEEFFGALISPR